MFSRVPEVVIRALPQIIWRMPPASRSVYLTFDDGPFPQATDSILAVLARFEAKATFMLEGVRAERDPGLVAEIVSAGHTVGCHGYHHVSLGLRSPGFIEAQVVRGRDAVASAAGLQPTLFRPPYGRFRPAVWRACAETGMRMVMWSYSTEDYRNEAKADSVYVRAAAEVKAGDIVLLHEREKWAERRGAALDEMLLVLAARGVVLKALSTRE